MIETLEKQLSEKGTEINAYMEKHQIQVKGGNPGAKTEEENVDAKDAKSGVLVSSPEKKA